VEEKTSLKYLFDASALYPLLKRFGAQVYDLTAHIAILDLTKYEIGNALWIETRRNIIKNWRTLAEAWTKVIKKFKELTIEDLAEVEKIAVKFGLTFYDAAYIATAHRNKLILVSQDREMLNKAGEIDVGTLSLDEFIKLRRF